MSFIFLVASDSLFVSWPCRLEFEVLVALQTDKQISAAFKGANNNCSTIYTLCWKQLWGFLEMAASTAFQKELDRVSVRFFDLGIPKKGFHSADRYCLEQSWEAAKDFIFQTYVPFLIL